jgi:hypothetical protein
MRSAGLFLSAAVERFPWGKEDFGVGQSSFGRFHHMEKAVWGHFVEMSGFAEGG